MLKVISFTICPFVQRVTALLEAKGIPYQVEYISLSDKPQWFLDLSPNGQVPLLVTEQGDTLFESDAIVEYLEEAYPALQPALSPVQKAQNRAWSYLGSKQYLVQCGAQSSKDADTLKTRSEKLATAFAKVEKVLGEHRFFNSDSLSMVDIAWLPLLHRAQIIKDATGYDFLHGFPKVQAWQAAVMATGLAQKSVAEAFDQRFADYYLSEQTLLGRCQRTCAPCDCHAQNLEADCCAEAEIRRCTPMPATSGCCDSSGCGDDSRCG
ncbi:glutathione S-transferase family protein [Ferrimonas balearica]|uniref:glutathione S-transferase family protein n=1 Tax=Ferrimonas balearica TaxID=44012 RepID=UPI001C9936F2|nr:glutathione S-transferase family protein [Ferrimonas balearica]MBY5994157.1 glutathione S-transferase family protein [Ferrimonas balearica]